MIDDQKNVKIPSKIIVPAIALIVGITFAVICFTDYGFWSTESARPTKGFFPCICAVCLTAISILALINGIRSPYSEFKLHNWYVPGAMLAIILASYVIGLVPSVIVFEILWLKVYEKLSWKTTLITLAVILFIVVGCFQIWLGVQFPAGIIYDSIFG